MAENQDPSMEEILSSIRRILTDEEEPNVEKEEKPEPKSEIAEEEKQNISDPIVNEVEVKVEEKPQAEEVKPEEKEEIVETPVENVVEKEYKPDNSETVLDLSKAMQVDDKETMVSKKTETETVKQVSNLVKTVVEQRSAAIGEGNATIENIVRELLKPMIKEWLDANLPYVVEKVVKKEVERVIEKAGNF